MAERTGGSRNIAPFTLSAILHAAVATLLFNTLKERKQVALPPMYRVNIVAAPPGERAIGEVKSGQPAQTPAVTQPSAGQSSVRETAVPKATDRSKVAAVPPKANVAKGSKTVQKTPSPTTSTTKPASTAAKAAPKSNPEVPKAG